MPVRAPAPAQNSAPPVVQKKTVLFGDDDDEEEDTPMFKSKPQPAAPA